MIWFNLVIFLLIGLDNVITEECTNIPTGINRMAFGVDISRLDLEPLDFTEPDGFAGRVIQYTCNEGKVWRNPYNNETFQMPDQILGIASIPGSWLNTETYLYQSRLDIKARFSSRAGLGIKLKMLGSFSASYSFRTMLNVLLEESLQITEVTSFVSTCQAAFAPAEVLGLSSAAKHIVDLLPEDFEASPEAYFSFIGYFGTHFLFKGEFGGYISIYYKTTSNYYSTSTVQNMKYQAKASFLGFLKAKAGYSGSVSAVDKKFTDHTSMDVIYRGGETSLLQTEDIPYWESSVANNPWLFAGQIVPVYKMINDSKKQNSMMLAVQAHLDKAYLVELADLLERASIKYTFADITTLYTLIQTGIELQSTLIPDHEKVTEFGNSVSYHLDKPDWWNQTQVCFKPRDGTASMTKCQESSAPFCAFTNQYTNVYYDYSYSNTLSCQMSWSVFAPAFADSWFLNAQICFRSETTGDFRQCGNSVQPFMSCAPFNSYTSEYLDATSSFTGGCNLRWMMKVNEQEAPFWFKNVKFCLYNKFLHALCGGVRSDKENCALPNEWTPAYFDDSQNTGCQLQWGLIDAYP